MPNTLAKICADKREHVARCRIKTTEQELRQKLHNLPKPRGFQRALESRVQKDEFGLIAEIKKASPSKGVIRENFDPVAIAKAYVEGGAACISVLTDIPYFQGSDDYLKQVRSTVELPLLRKDFMIDSYQIVESRVLGADCILLIMAALDNAQARDLEAAAMQLGMDVLVEVHDEKELERALRTLKSTLIGINNRNLKTLEVDISTTKRLAKLLPKGVLGVCESGISGHETMKEIEKSKISCFLVGESLMREADVAAATKSLLGIN